MYDPSKIEPKWQKYWKDNKTFKAEVDLKKKKYYRPTDRGYEAIIRKLIKEREEKD